MYVRYVFFIFLVLTTFGSHSMFIADTESILGLIENERLQPPIAFQCQSDSFGQAENFINTFSSSDLQTLSKKLCGLSSRDRIKAFSCLNDNQKFLMRISCLPDDIKFSIAALLFNGNRVFGKEYCGRPIGQALDRYPRAEKLVNYYNNFSKGMRFKLADDNVQCYALDLTQTQISVLQEGLKYGQVSLEDAAIGVQAIKKFNARTDRDYFAGSIKIGYSYKEWVSALYCVCKKVVFASYKDLKELLIFMLAMRLYPRFFIKLIFFDYPEIIFSQKESHKLMTAFHRHTTMILAAFLTHSFLVEYQQEKSKMLRKQPLLMLLYDFY